MQSVRNYLRAAYTPEESWVGPDKVYHMAVGAAAALIVGYVSHSPWAGVAFAAIIGFIKEVYDYQHRASHTPSLRDAVMTVVGGFVGAGAATALLSY